MREILASGPTVLSRKEEAKWLRQSPTLLRLISNSNLFDIIFLLTSIKFCILVQILLCVCECNRVGPGHEFEPHIGNERDGGQKLAKSRGGAANRNRGRREEKRMEKGKSEEERRREPKKLDFFGQVRIDKEIFRVPFDRDN